MSRLGSPTAFNPDGGQSTGLATTKKKKRLSPDQEPINSAGPRPRLNDLRRTQLERQGIDTGELRSSNRQSRAAIRDSGMDRVGQGKVARRLERDGDIAGAEAIRSQLRAQRAVEDEMKYEVAGRSSLLRGRLSDLPPEQQVAERQRGRDSLNRQLPGIAAGAATAASNADDARMQKLAEIGAQVFELQSGSQSAEGLNPAELIRLAEGASPEVINRVTNGVGLPRAQTSLRDFADRTQSLSETGVDFGPNVARTREIDTDLMDQIRAEQETAGIQQAAMNRLQRDEIEQGLLASSNQTAGLNRDGSVIEQERTAAELGASGNIASQANIPLRQRVEEAQANEQIAQSNANARNAEFVQSQIGDPEEVGRESLTPEERISYEIGPRDTLNAIRGAPRSEETEIKLTGALEQVRTAILTLTPTKAAQYAREMLENLESAKADDGDLEDGGFREPLGSVAALTRDRVGQIVNPLNPLSLLRTARDIGGAFQTENERARGPVADETYRTIIRELRAAANQGS